jgi:AraC-like DNA-binding protein
MLGLGDSDPPTADAAPVVFDVDRPKRAWHAEDRPRATLRTVAQCAGVSIKTVSRVLNDERGVRPDTAARVMHAVRLLHYRPDGNARLLRLGTAVRAKHVVAIGLLVWDRSDPCLAGLVRSADATAAEHGVVVLMASRSRVYGSVLNICTATDTGASPISASRRERPLRTSGCLPIAGYSPRSASRSTNS